MLYGSASCGRGKSVLVVEPEDNQRAKLRGALSRMDYDVTAVASGRQALAMVNGYRPFDLLIADVVAGDMDGITLARRALVRQPEAKVLLVSKSCADVFFVQPALRERIIFMPKPERVLPLVRKVMELAPPPARQVRVRTAPAHMHLRLRVQPRPTGSIALVRRARRSRAELLETEAKVVAAYARAVELWGRIRAGSR
jgi:CheY-like chemotaxis protein